MTKQSPDIFLHRKITGGPDVLPTLGKQQIDFGRPATDAFDHGQRGDRFFVVSGQIVEVECAARDEFGKATAITDFLARQACCTQGFVAGCDHDGGILDRRHSGGEFEPYRIRRFETDLLPDDRTQQCDIAPVADARFGIAGVGNSTRERRFDLAQRIEMLAKLFSGEAHGIP